MQLRRNHEKQSGGFASGRVMVIVGVVIGLIGLLAYKGNEIILFLSDDSGQEKSSSTSDQTTIGNADNSDVTLNDLKYPYLPISKGDVVYHQYYTLSYREDHEQAEWVAYELTQDLLRKPNVPRSNRFERDPMVNSGSAGYYDYQGSGYTRGHLAPAGDMSFDKLAMYESFYMSNMSPQLRAFNNGVWKELEEQTRDWVYHNDHLYIVSGPILPSRSIPKTKKGKVSIPPYFYKVLLDNTGNQKKGIAFLIPHERTATHLKSFAVSIDSIEAITGIDFFSKLDDDNKVESLEHTFDVEQWMFSDARYKLRVERWNFE